MDFYKDHKEILTKIALDTIMVETCQEIEDGESHPHSYHSILASNRKFSIGARMISHPVDFFGYRLNNDNKIIKCSKGVEYSGKEIADVFIKSVELYGKTYYPLTGDFTKIKGIQHLILFVKSKEEKKYLPYAIFDITSITSQQEIDSSKASYLTDLSPVCNCTYKSILEITNVKKENLPTHFLGNRSGQDIYDVAFKGSSSNVLMI